jgi:hypothetical protein
MMCTDVSDVVHLTRHSSSDLDTDLQPATSLLFSPDATDDEEREEKADADQRPRVLWSLQFQLKDVSAVSRSPASPENVFVARGPGTELDTDRCVEEVSRFWIFMCLCG